MMEKINYLRSSLKNVSERTMDELFIVLLLILVSTGSFGLGRLSKIDEARTPVEIYSPDEPQGLTRAGGPAAASASAPPAAVATSAAASSIKPPVQQNAPLEARIAPSGLPAGQAGGAVVGSKNGTKYHYPWCAGAQTIKEENKIFFASIEEARAKGYTPAANCKGLQ
jgi:hypothetical protein